MGITIMLAWCYIRGTIASMSSHEQYNEQERPPISAIRRYYSDLYYAENNLSTIAMATHELFDGLPFQSSLQFDKIFDVDFIEHELESEPRIARELLAMMPFMYIGPELEKSNCSTQYVKDWYIDATKGLIMLTKEDHDVACLESDGGTLNHMQCDKSTHCPHRFLERYLTDDICLVDFEDRRYEKDAMQTMAMAMVKMQVAKECQVVLAVYGETALRAYSDKCQEYFDQMINQREISVDDILSR